MHKALAQTLIFACLHVCLTPAWADAWRDELDPILRTHCASCHEGSDAEGELDLTELPNDFSDAEVMRRWVLIYDRVVAGEMPPPEDSFLLQADQAKITTTLGATLMLADRKRSDVVLRRLNRNEYENTVRDLFDVDVQAGDLLPGDTSTDANRPKVHVDAKPPRDQPDRTRMIERLELMYDMMHLAIETDSTRFMTFFDTGMNAVPVIRGVDTDYHMLSHHGKDPTKIEQLTTVETEVMRALSRFLTKLAGSQEDEATLLDRTQVLFGSNLGNASSHDSTKDRRNNNWRYCHNFGKLV